MVADGWYAVGPALVIAAFAAGAAGRRRLRACCCSRWWRSSSVDFVASTLREWFGAGISPAELLPVLALVYLIDASLAPIGFLAVLASEVHEHAYLLAIAPGALLGLIARERSGRIAHELALERAFRRSTRALDARAEDLRRQAGRAAARARASAARGPRRARADAAATTIEALQADCGPAERARRRRRAARRG